MGRVNLFLINIKYFSYNLFISSTTFFAHPNKARKLCIFISIHSHNTFSTLFLCCFYLFFSMKFCSCDTQISSFYIVSSPFVPYYSFPFYHYFFCLIFFLPFLFFFLYFIRFRFLFFLSVFCSSFLSSFFRFLFLSFFSVFHFYFFFTFFCYFFIYLFVFLLYFLEKLVRRELGSDTQYII